MRLQTTLKSLIALVCIAASCWAQAQDVSCSCTLKRGDSPSKAVEELGLPAELTSMSPERAYPFLAFYSERSGIRAYFDESKKFVQLQIQAPSSCLIAGVKPGDFISDVKEQNGRPITTFFPDADSIVWTYSNDPLVLKGEKELLRAGEYVRYWFGRSKDNKAVVTTVLSSACSVPLRKSL